MRRVGLWVVKRVATWVSRNELFEQDGERPAQVPLEKKAWTGATPVGDDNTGGENDT